MGMPVQRETIRGDLILGDAFVYQGEIFIFNLFFLDGKLLLEFGQFAVLELCSLVQVVVLFCLLESVCSCLRSAHGVWKDFRQNVFHCPTGLSWY